MSPIKKGTVKPVSPALASGVSVWQRVGSQRNSASRSSRGISAYLLVTMVWNIYPTDHEQENPAKKPGYGLV
jgi:hypothetical protein